MKKATNEDNAQTSTPRSTSRSALVTPLGVTRISDEAVARLAGELVYGFPGVHELLPTDVGQSITHLGRRATGNRMRKLGIEAEVGREEAAIDLRITVEYPHSLHTIAAGVAELLKRELGRMTGLRVVEVNVEVVDLYFAEDESPTKQSRLPHEHRPLQ